MPGMGVAKEHASRAASATVVKSNPCPAMISVPNAPRSTDASTMTLCALGVAAEGRT